VLRKPVSTCDSLVDDENPGVLGVNQDMVVPRGKVLGVHSGAVGFFPDNVGQKIRAAKDLVAQHLAVMGFVIVERDPRGPVSGQKMAKKLQTITHQL
jgi:hypothetical protein